MRVFLMAVVSCGVNWRMTLRLSVLRFVSSDQPTQAAKSIKTEFQHRQVADIKIRPRMPQLQAQTILWLSRHY